MKGLKTWAAAAGLVSLTGAAPAALVSLGDGTVKDTNTNLIWLENWNVTGLQIWSAQKAWAEGLDFAGSTEWRLPEIGEYADLFNAYGDLTQLVAFSNLRHSLYWSGTEISAGLSAMVFVPTDSSLFDSSQDLDLYAVAVRRGDVVTGVPEPQTLALALLALGAAVGVRRRRSR